AEDKARRDPDTADAHCRKLVRQEGPELPLRDAEGLDEVLGVPGIDDAPSDEADHHRAGGDGPRRGVGEHPAQDLAKACWLFVRDGLGVAVVAVAGLLSRGEARVGARAVTNVDGREAGVSGRVLDEAPVEQEEQADEAPWD